MRTAATSPEPSIAALAALLLQRRVEARVDAAAALAAITSVRSIGNPNVS